MNSAARKITALRSKTVSRGASVSEAKAAQAKADQIESALNTKRDEAIAILVKLGWSPEQAQAIAFQLTFEEPLNICRWQGERLAKLNDWCSANERDRTTLNGQLSHLHWELTNSYHGIGTEVSQCKSAEGASKAFAKYFGGY